MSTKKLFPGVAFAGVAAALAVPLLLGAQKPDGTRTGYAPASASGDIQTPPGSTGWGKGSIVMPVREQPGMVVGVLTECDAPTKYVFEGELTGFMPSTGLSGGAEYWFGGMYGKMQQVAFSEPDPGKEEIPWFEVEGMWVLDKHFEGSFSAQLLACNEAGTQYPCGVVEGRFQVSDAMPGPSTGSPAQPMSFKSYAGRKPFGKPKTGDAGVADRASDSGTITCPKATGQVDDAAPPKQPLRRGPLGYLTTFQDADESRRSKTGGQYEELPCDAGWRDIRSTQPPFGTPETPNWPVLMGTFDLRYQLYE
jgi:hypothetical protein